MVITSLSTENKVPSGRGFHLIITHIESDAGFVNGGLRTFKLFSL